MWKAPRRGLSSPRFVPLGSTARSACPCCSSRPWLRTATSFASGCTPTCPRPTRSISARARQLASTFRPRTDWCSWWRGGVSGQGHRSRRIGQRLSMSLGVVAALLSLQHLRASRGSPGLAADVLPIAAVLATMRRAQSAEGAAGMAPRLRSFRRRVFAGDGPKLRTSAVRLAASPNERLPLRHSIGPSGPRLRPCIRLLGGLAAFRPRHWGGHLGHPKDLDVSRALGHGDPGVRGETLGAYAKGDVGTTSPPFQCTRPFTLRAPERLRWRSSVAGSAV